MDSAPDVALFEAVAQILPVLLLAEIAVRWTADQATRTGHEQERRKMLVGFLYFVVGELTALIAIGNPDRYANLITAAIVLGAVGGAFASVMTLAAIPWLRAKPTTRGERVVWVLLDWMSVWVVFSFSSIGILLLRLG